METAVSRRAFIRRSVVGGIGASIAIGGESAEASQTSSGTKQPFQGIFPIMQTPYREDDKIDLDVLMKEVNFIIEAGGHGLCWPQLASEFYVLTDDERMKTAELIVREARGRIPVIIGVQTTNYWKASLKFAKHAASIGADGIISLPPYQSKPTVNVVAEYYRTLARTISLPIFIQNSGDTYGPAMPIDMMVSIAREYPTVAYIKEEAKPVLDRIAELAKEGKGVIKGVFSGAGGANLLNEMKKGSNGSCPGTAFIDIFAEIFNNNLAGDKKLARKMFETLLPILKYKKISWLLKEKELLRWRGIFKNTRCRVAPYELTLDKEVEKELEALYDNLKPYFKI